VSERKSFYLIPTQKIVKLQQWRRRSIRLYQRCYPHVMATATSVYLYWLVPANEFASFLDFGKEIERVLLSYS